MTKKGAGNGMNRNEWTPLTHEGLAQVERRAELALAEFDLNDNDESRHIVVNREVVESQSDVYNLLKTLKAEIAANRKSVDYWQTVARNAREDKENLLNTVDLLLKALLKCRPFIEDRYDILKHANYIYGNEEITEAYAAMIDALRDAGRLED